MSLKSFFYNSLYFTIAIFLLYLLYVTVLHVTGFGYKRRELNTLDKTIIETGFKEMKQHRIIIAGITRDDIASLPTMRRYIEQLGKNFKDYKVVIFENDSKDGTKEFLTNWKNKNPKINILSKDFYNKKRPDTGFIARARNVYLEEIETNNIYEDYDIIMLVDMDMTYKWDERGIAHSFANIEKWDAVCANGIFTRSGKMWDMFAFRNDEFPNCEGANAELGQKVYPIGSALVPVESCFNGMAFYKRKYLNNCRYLSDDQCEHISFHKCLINNGGKMFMNPSQVIIYSHYPPAATVAEDDLPKQKQLRSIYKAYNRDIKWWFEIVDKIENYIFF